MNNIKFTHKYWDCECETNYIRPASVGSCSLCGAIREEQPDSLVNEVVAAGVVIPATIIFEGQGSFGPILTVSITPDGATLFFDESGTTYCCSDSTGILNRGFADRAYSFRGGDLLLVAVNDYPRRAQWVVDGRKDFESLSESEQRAVKFFGLEFK